MKQLKKFVSVITMFSLLGAFMCGCSNSEKTSGADGKIQITVGDWPTKEEPEYPIYEELKTKFEEKYPDIKVTTDEWGFHVNTFLQKAASGQLPSVYVTSFTEIKRIIDTGYAADVTTHMKGSGFDTKIREDVLDLISKEGNIYAVPAKTYAMGLYINMNLFEKAGLVNEDGTPKIPKTWEDVAEYSQIIREKTGQAGLVLPTMKNTGGWHFINIAWAYGANPQLMTKESDKWVADFSGEECTAALQYVKDLRWKYNAIPENALIEHNKAVEMFATDKAAMFLGTPGWNALTDTYGMDKDKIAMAGMPAGPAGKCTQMGGTLYVLKGGMTDEEVDACFKWLEFSGVSPNLTEDARVSMEEEYKANVEQNRVTGIKGFSMWKNGEDVEVEKYTNELIAKYKNVDEKLFADYESFADIEIIPEPPVNCQQLYAALDGCIQKVIAEESADPAELLKTAENDFQLNYLDGASF